MCLLSFSKNISESKGGVAITVFANLSIIKTTFNKSLIDRFFLLLTD